jgi:hypothetical protein
MTVHLSASGTILLKGACPSDDAEALLQHLLAAPGARVDWSACESAHTAVIQVLMAAHPRLIGKPLGVELTTWVRPVLEQATS